MLEHHLQVLPFSLLRLVAAAVAGLDVRRQLARPFGAPGDQQGVNMVRSREAAQGGATSATIVLEDVPLAESQGWRLEGEVE